MLKEINDNKFEKEVIEGKGITLVDFYAKWCGPCMILSKTLKEIEEAEVDCNIFEINIDENPKIVSDLSIDTIPAICIYKDGVLVDKKIGIKQKSEILNLLEKYKK